MKYYLVEIWLPVEKDWQSIEDFTPDGFAVFNSLEHLSLQEANTRFLILAGKHPNFTFRISDHIDPNE